MTSWNGCLLAAAIILAACAESVPPKQLLDARAAYERVRAGKAAQYAPADLHTAKVALTAAENACEDDPESAETLALAYVALRTAELVEAKANTKAAEADLARADEEFQRLAESEMSRTRGELARTQEQLRAERKARTEAEQRYGDTMRKLAEAAALNMKEESRGTVIVLPGSVLFRSGESTLTPMAQQKLTLIAGTLAPQAEEHDIVVEGHTDSRGSRGSNMQLSAQRAQTVVNFLVSRGVPGEAVSAVGVGPDRPIANNSNRDGRAENRRVEIVIKPRS
jgi:outer membrane protein OmpA-like peptidoglycan-associated protein